MNNCPNCGNNFQHPMGDCFVVFALDKQYYCRQSCIVEFYKDKTDLLISEYEKLKAANVLINNLYNSAMDDVHNAEKRIETLTLENDSFKRAWQRYENWLSGR